VLDIKRVKLLEEENSPLKQLVADLSLDKVMLQDLLAKELQGLLVGVSWCTMWKRPTRSGAPWM
jgi:hypothetical protein